MFCWGVFVVFFNTVILCATDAWFILCTNKIYTYVLKKSNVIFFITKGSVNALMKCAGYKVKNHWCRVCLHCGGVFIQQCCRLRV